MARKKRRNNKQNNGQAPSNTTAQPKLHENMDEVDLHRQQGTIDDSPKIKSAKFVPLSLVMNNTTASVGIDPPDDDDDNVDSYRRPTEDFSDVETNDIAKHLQNNHHEEEMFRRDQNDHSFTQFHIPPPQPQQQQQHQYNSEDSHESDSNSNEYSSSEEESDEETATLFTSQFQYATDKPTNFHREGEDFGIDYLASRAERRAMKRRQQQQQQRFEIESRHGQNSAWRWCWEEEEFDDVDFMEYQESFRKRALVMNTVIFFLSFIFGMVIMEHQFHFIRGKSSRMQHNAALASHDHGNASSRWGHRFDDDAVNGDDAVFDVKMGSPKYHSHNHHNHEEMTEEEIKEDIEKWEDYEMDVANLLANSGSDWDIHSKSGGAVDDEDSEEVNDLITDHWIQYYDESSLQFYYFHKETNTTTWTKPEIVEGTVLMGLTRLGSEYVLEEFKADTDEVLDDVSGEAATTENSTLDADAVVENEIEADDISSTPTLEIPSNFDPQVVLDQYKSTMWRWNHPYRTPERTEVWGGIDTPVFWHIPHSAATTVEEIFEHCYHMVIAGTTGSNNDGKIMKKRNVTDVSYFGKYEIY